MIWRDFTTKDHFTEMWVKFGAYSLVLSGLPPNSRKNHTHSWKRIACHCHLTILHHSPDLNSNASKLMIHSKNQNSPFGLLNVFQSPKFSDSKSELRVHRACISSYLDCCSNSVAPLIPIENNHSLLIADIFFHSLMSRKVGDTVTVRSSTHILFRLSMTWTGCQLLISKHQSEWKGCTQC